MKRLFALSIVFLLLVISNILIWGGAALGILWALKLSGVQL